MEFEFDKEMDSLLRQSAKGENLFATANPPAEHIDADEISMFAENALTEKAKPRVMKHLADCDRCRTILSNVIVLNAEAEPEVAAIPAQETKVETVVASTEPNWFQKIFSTKNLAFGMGALALVFALGIGFIVIQNALNPGESQLAQADKAAANTTSENEVPESVAQESSNSNTPSATDEANVTDDAETPMEANGLNSESNSSKTEGSSASADRKVSNEDGIIGKNNPVSNGRRDEQKPGSPTDDGKLKEKSDADEFSLKDEIETKTEVESDDAPAPVNKPKKSPPPPPSAKSPITSRSGVTRTRNNDSAVSELPVQERELSKKAEIGTKINGKTFTIKDKVWYDSAYKGQATTNVRRGTDQYKKLDSGLQSIGNQLSGTVVVVWKSKAYRIQ